MRNWLLTLVCMTAAGSLLAADAPADLIEVPPPDLETEVVRRPAPPPTADEEAGMEPQVIIRKSGQNQVEEYRVNNKLYKVKITPPSGPSYYLMDTDGDGFMDTRRNDLNAGMVVPQWVLFRW